MSVRLTATQLKAYREAKLREQGGRCALTHYPLSPADAVVDHCHVTGHIRGVIHRGANALLGKIENNHKRYGVSLPMVYALGRNLEAYLSQDHTARPHYPTYRTEEEKRLKRNKAARDRRAALKKGE